MAYENLHFEPGFASERSQLKAIDSTITNELASMERTLDGMNSYWKDDKSADFIASAKDYIAQVRVKQEEAIQSGNEILTSVENALKIYEG